MTDLVVCTGIEGLPQLKRLASAESWSNIFIIASEQIQIRSSKKVFVETILADAKLEEATERIARFLSGKIDTLDVAVNFSDGNGVLHMATLAALLKLGAGIRQVAATEEGVKEI